MDDGLTRAERRAQSRPSSRTGLVVGAVVVVLIAVAVGAVLVLSGGSSDDAEDAAGARQVANTDISIEAGEVTADSAGPPVSVSPEQATAVIDLIGDYVETAIVKPLRTGQPAGDLAGVFDATALTRAQGVDRAALVDEGLPKVTGNLTVTATPVAITGLGDQAGNLVALTATVDLDVSASAVGTAVPLHIVRTGHFVLSPDGSGAWKVSAFDVQVTRDGGGIDVPVTTAVVAR